MRIGEICFLKSARLADGFSFVVVSVCFFDNSAEFARPIVRASVKGRSFSDDDDFWALQKMVDAKRQNTVLPSRILGRMGNRFIVASMPMQRGPWDYLLMVDAVIYRANFDQNMNVCFS